MVQTRTTSISRSMQKSAAFSSTVKREALSERFKVKLSVNPALDRALVSFQANKHAPFSDWFKYREGFSESLVTYLLDYLGARPGILLDPFSGGGSALFAAHNKGWQTVGIEVLPVGIYATRARLMARHVDVQALLKTIEEIKSVNFLDYYSLDADLQHIAITRGAFPFEEQKQLVGYRAYCERCISDEPLRTVLLYAAFCILEAISYTRKDGQYLRWDVRSGTFSGQKSVS